MPTRDIIRARTRSASERSAPHTASPERQALFEEKGPPDLNRPDEAEIAEKASAGQKIFAGIMIAAATAFIGYFISYLDQHKKDQVQFVSTQIEKLYGPLFALTQANDIAWTHFHDGYWPERKSYFPNDRALTSGEVQVWRRWMKTVFQPLNERMERAITDNAQLLVGNQMPPLFLQLAAHTEAYKAIIAKWDSPGDTNSKDYLFDKGNSSPVFYPRPPVTKYDISVCVRDQFDSLTKLKQELSEQFIGSFGPLKEKIVPSCGIPATSK